jgi:hypothetical protein
MYSMICKNILIVRVMFGNFDKIGRAADILLNVNMSLCQHHIFSRQKPVLQDFQPKFGAFVRIFT